MTREEKLCWMAVWVYIIGAPVAFGFCVHRLLSVSADIGAIFAAGFIAAAWPLSGLIWLGSWLAS
jgi:hypothetical protein